MQTPDQVFDGIADKFADNIYGTSKGRLRHILLCDAIAPWLPETPARVAELGGGTGVMAQHIASQGHQVTLFDASDDVLVHAREIARAQPGMHVVQARLQDVTTLGDYDFIVCHAVLEWLSAPYEAIEHIASQMHEGMRLSLSFFNREAALFSNALYGNFDYIRRGMKVKNQVRLNPHSPLPVKAVMAACESAGLQIVAKTGIRCFHDYLRDKQQQTECFDDLLALERQYNQQEPYLWLGRYFHLMLERQG
ncbi:methyltransferase domain-containing protein [Alteromonas sp. CYL-A6]|uniref:methyltransferase domain-containing protein n=1 Tax=Alteromonas nitratireducens TaxID=3390813 RepID=UPI0034A880A3